MSSAAESEALETARAAVGNLSGLATLPELTSQIIAMVENPRTTAADVRKAVSQDPALVARVLKVVNSSYFSLSGRVDSLERAIVLLGLNAVKNLAVGAGLGHMFRVTKLCAGFTAKDLWKHCIAVAVTSRELARQVAPKQMEAAFLAGMVHDMGILASLQLWPEKLQAVCEEVARTGRSFVETEREQMGTDHQLLGQALAEQWKFPVFCQTVAAHHHDAELPPQLSKDDMTLVSLLRAADVICCRSKHGFNLTALHPSGNALQELDPNVVQSVSAKLDEMMTAAAPLLS